MVAAIATGGSLFFSEIAHFVPCELCWFQRICMYPLSILTLIAAVHGDHRFARYLLPLPVVGAGVSVYHILVENGVVEQAKACLVSAPGGCATKWIDQFGYMTIPTLTLTGFVLLIAFLALAGAEEAEGQLPCPPVPSGKKSKQIRRAAAAAPPPVVSKGGTRRRQANPRVLAIAAGVVALAGIGIGLAIALSGGSKPSIPKDIPTFGSIANGLPGSAEVAALYKGIPQKGLVLGSEFAPTQMVDLHRPPVPAVQGVRDDRDAHAPERVRAPGKLRIEVKPWAFIGPDSTRGQKAMFAAAKQNKAFNFAADPLRQPGHREHRLAHRQHGVPGGRQHPRAERAAAADGALVLERERPDRRRRRRSRRQ